jgi:hypothetical protein
LTDLLLFAHILSAFWYVMGLAAVQLSYVRALRSEDLSERINAVEEASHYNGVLLVPGAIALGFSGAFYWADAGYNLITDEWLWLLEAAFLVTVLVCLPLIGAGLRRVRIAALKARRDPEAAANLERALTDGVPLIFGALATALVVLMTAVSVWGP